MLQLCKYIYDTLIKRKTVQYIQLTTNSENLVPCKKMTWNKSTLPFSNLSFSKKT